MKTKLFSIAIATAIMTSVATTTAFAVESTTETTVSSVVSETEIIENATDLTAIDSLIGEYAENSTEETTETPDYYNDPYYDTDGNATLIESEKIIYDTEEMQFIAVTTKDGHVFYVLINYSAENGEDNVYFLNKVDDYDLYALLYAGEEDEEGNPTITPEQAAEAAENANGRTNSNKSTDKAEKSESATENTQEVSEVTEKKSVPMNMTSIYLVIGVIAVGAIGFVAFKFMKKPKNKAELSENEDEDFNFYDEDEEINEDEE